VIFLNIKRNENEQKKETFQFFLFYVGPDFFNFPVMTVASIGYFSLSRVAMKRLSPFRK